VEHGEVTTEKNASYIKSETLFPNVQQEHRYKNEINTTIVTYTHKC